MPTLYWFTSGYAQVSQIKYWELWRLGSCQKKKKQKTQPTVDLYSLMYCPSLYQLVHTLDLRELSIRGRSDAQSKEAIW